MERICNFNEWMLLKEDGRRTGAKTALYPLSYGGIGLYPDADFMTHAADAAYYLDNDTRLYSNGDKTPWDITHLHGHKQFGDKINNGEGEPWDITHLRGEIIPPKDSTMPGKSVPFKSFVKLSEPNTMTPPDASYLPPK